MGRVGFPPLKRLFGYFLAVQKVTPAERVPPKATIPQPPAAAAPFTPGGRKGRRVKDAAPYDGLGARKKACDDRKNSFTNRADCGILSQRAFLRARTRRLSSGETPA